MMIYVKFILPNSEEVIRSCHELPREDEKVHLGNKLYTVHVVHWFERNEVDEILSEMIPVLSSTVYLTS